MSPYPPCQESLHVPTVCVHASTEMLPTPRGTLVYPTLLSAGRQTSPHTQTQTISSQGLLCQWPPHLPQALPRSHWQALPNTAWKRDLLLPYTEQGWCLGLAHGIPTGPCPASEQLWRGPLPAAGRHVTFFRGEIKYFWQQVPPWRLGPCPSCAAGRWWLCRHPASTTRPPWPQPHMPGSAAVTTCQTGSHFSRTSRMGEANAPKGKVCFSALVATRPEAPEVQEVGEFDLLPGEALAELSNNTAGVMAFWTDKWYNRDILEARRKGFDGFFKCRSP